MARFDRRKSMKYKIAAYMAGAFAIFCLGHLSGSHAETTNDPLENTLWSKELQIYAGRAHGNLQFYLDHTSPKFLAWPPISDRPIGNDGLRKTTSRVAAGHEVIKSEPVGFTQDGDTALIYYINHRTVRPDGTKVDESFGNIHVWIKRNGNWVLLGGMARLLPAAKSQ
jgi:hypothetical protein